MEDFFCQRLSVFFFVFVYTHTSDSTHANFFVLLSAPSPPLPPPFRHVCVWSLLLPISLISQPHLNHG